MIAEQIDPDANDSFPVVSRLQIDMMVMAMACDLTRVGSIMWNRSVGGARHTWVDPAMDRGHHDLSHDGDTLTDTVEKLTKINVWYAEQFAYLLKSLNDIPEGDGTMLDNTLIVWGNELADGWSHSQHPIPLVLAGRAGGALQTGRYLDFGDARHNGLLVSLCNIMGLSEVTSFGSLDDGSGPLAGLV